MEPQFNLNGSTLVTIGAVIGALSGAITYLTRQQQSLYLKLIESKEQEIKSLQQELVDLKKELRQVHDLLRTERDFFRDRILEIQRRE